MWRHATQKNSAGWRFAMGAAWYERQGPNIELDEQLLPVGRMIAT